MLNANWIIFGAATLGIGIGVLGTLLPFIPGLGLIFLVIGLVKWLRPEEIHTWLVVAAGVTFILVWLIEWIVGGVGVKILGGTRWGILGAIIGGIVGLLFLPIGLIIGPMLGAIIGEVWMGKHTIRQSIKIGLGAGISLILLVIFKLLAAISLGALFILDYLG
jgi:uncharacterized protein YqgC (DUF456 family)